MKVTDNGPGIAEELKEKIFEPFFTGKERGTGLGLPLVQTILRAHQGTVTVERTDAGGSCFTLRVPRAAGEGLVDGKVDGRSVA